MKIYSAKEIGNGVLAEFEYKEGEDKLRWRTQYFKSWDEFYSVIKSVPLALEEERFKAQSYRMTELQKRIEVLENQSKKQV